MEDEQSSTGWRTAGAWALVAVAVLGALGVGAGATGVPVTADAADEVPADAEPPRQGPNETTAGTNETTTAEANATTNVTVPVVEAMRAAQNATNGTAVGAELAREGDVTDLERPTRIYEVDVLLPNGTVLVASVNATDGRLRGVEQADSETSLFDELFGGDEGVPSDRVNISSIRSAIEAVELVRNQTGENATVTTIKLDAGGDRLNYTVEMASAEGIRSTVTVAADPEQGGVLTTQTDD